MVATRRYGGMPWPNGAGARRVLAVRAWPSWAVMGFVAAVEDPLLPVLHRLAALGPPRLAMRIAMSVRGVRVNDSPGADLPPENAPSLAPRGDGKT